MLKISEEEYRSLEMKVQMEVQRIFLQFLEDHERMNSETHETADLQESQIPKRLTEQDHGNSDQAPAEPRKCRASRKSTEMGRLLTGPAHGDRKSSAKILEDDMDKIFRKRSRRGTS